MSHATIGIADHTAADRLRDRDNATRISDNAAAIGDNATGIVDNAARIGDDSTGIGDDAARIVAITANVIPF